MKKRWSNSNVFYQADLGVKLSSELTQKIRDLHIRQPHAKPDELLKEINAIS